MPLHSSSRSGAVASSKSSSSTKTSAAGGANVSVGSRSQVTGRQLGRAAVRALNKNAEVADEYLDAVESATSLSDLSSLASSAFVLGRVERNPGGGRLKVLLQTGAAGQDVTISGNLRFKGAASKKTDRANCFCANDVIVIRGGLASSKLTAAAASRVRRVFVKYGLSFPAGFFLSGVAAEEAADEDFEFDRSDEEAEEAAMEVARLEEERRKASVKNGGSRGGRRIDGRALVNEALFASAVVADAEAEEDDEAEEAEATMKKAEAKEKASLNRAERRAAALAAQAASEADVADFALYADCGRDEDVYASVALPGNVDKAWDEVDIDAI